MGMGEGSLKPWDSPKETQSNRYHSGPLNVFKTWRVGNYPRVPFQTRACQSPASLGLPTRWHSETPPQIYRIANICLHSDLGVLSLRAHCPKYKNNHGFREVPPSTAPRLLSFLFRSRSSRSTPASYFIMLTSRYIGLSTQSVGVGPGTYHAPDQLLYSEPNRLSPVTRFETSWLHFHACVSPRPILILVDPDSFSSLRCDHT